MRSLSVPTRLRRTDQGLVVLRFSEPVLDGSENVAFYSIDDPDLDILGAALSDDGLTVTLTTEAQTNRSYTVGVTNVRSRAGGFFIDPERSTASFVGIPPVDDVKPTVTGAESTGTTGVLVSFSEPLLPGADDPLNFTIACVTLAGDPCGDLTVTAAELTSFNTQVHLMMTPQTAFVEYTVSVADRCAISQDNCVQDLQENPVDLAANSAKFFFDGSPAFSEEAPRVVCAISTGNTTVVIQFSRPMSDSVLDPSLYFIVQENIHPEVGALIVVSRCMGGPDDGDTCSDDTDCTGGFCVGSRFVGPGRLAVEIKTLSQNEVTYAITAINVTDVAGRPIQLPIVTPGGLLVDPRTASFPGSPPSGETFVDTDLDGLTDNVEQRGWLVSIELTNGTTVEREVTSTPSTRMRTRATTSSSSTSSTAIRTIRTRTTTVSAIRSRCSSSARTPSSTTRTVTASPTTRSSSSSIAIRARRPPGTGHRRLSDRPPHRRAIHLHR